MRRNARAEKPSAKACENKALMTRSSIRHVSECDADFWVVTLRLCLNGAVQRAPGSVMNRFIIISRCEKLKENKKKKGKAARCARVKLEAATRVKGVRCADDSRRGNQWHANCRYFLRRFFFEEARKTGRPLKLARIEALTLRARFLDRSLRKTPRSRRQGRRSFSPHEERRTAKPHRRRRIKCARPKHGAPPGESARRPRSRTRSGSFSRVRRDLRPAFY